MSTKATCKRSTLQQPQGGTILAFDPGKLTGYALLQTNNGKQQITAAGTIPLTRNYQKAAAQIEKLLDTHKPDHVVIEGWENQGKRVDINSSLPNVIIGMLAALTQQKNITLQTTYASQWKNEFARAANLLPPVPQSIPKEDDRLARRIQVELSLWPQALAELRSPHLGHAVNATALTLWARLHARPGLPAQRGA